MSAARHTLRVVFTPGVHISKAAKDAIAARLCGVRVRRNLFADFMTVANCRLTVQLAALRLRGIPHVMAVEDDSQRVDVREDWAAIIAGAYTLSELDGIVPALRMLPEPQRIELRPRWLARRARIEDWVARGIEPGPLDHKPYMRLLA